MLSLLTELCAGPILKLVSKVKTKLREPFAVISNTSKGTPYKFSPLYMLLETNVSSDALPSKAYTSLLPLEV